jgi:hypothetical protein
MKLHRKVLLKHCSYYSDTRGVTVGPVNTSATLNPHELGDTSARRGYGGKPVDGPVSVQVHFS